MSKCVNVRIARDSDLKQRQASADADQVFADNLGALRNLMNNLKNIPAFTDGMGTAMGIFSTTSQKDPATTKPRIKAEPQPGHVRITGSKDYAELYNVYMRLLGTSTWAKVGVNRKKFPFDDQTPLKAAGTPEVREYAARGVINDEEVGEMSNIVQVTFAG